MTNHIVKQNTTHSLKIIPYTSTGLRNQNRCHSDVFFRLRKKAKNKPPRFNNRIESNAIFWILTLGFFVTSLYSPFWSVYNNRFNAPIIHLHQTRSLKAFQPALWTFSAHLLRRSWISVAAYPSFQWHGKQRSNDCHGEKSIDLSFRSLFLCMKSEVNVSWIQIPPQADDLIITAFPQVYTQAFPSVCTLKKEVLVPLCIGNYFFLNIRTLNRYYLNCQGLQQGLWRLPYRRETKIFDFWAPSPYN